MDPLDRFAALALVVCVLLFALCVALASCATQCNDPRACLYWIEYHRWPDAHDAGPTDD